MRNYYTVIYLFAGILLCQFFFNCGPVRVENDIVGQWTADETAVTVRYRENGEFKFVHGIAKANLIIGQDKLAQGNIGNSHFSNAQISLNWGLPGDVTGIKYTIICYPEGKIFSEAPVEYDKVEFWIGNIIVPDSFSAELRYTKNMAHFPMAAFQFKRVSN